MNIKEISKSITTFSIPHKTYGLEFGATMTVVRLSDSKLWVHSPLPLTKEIRTKVEKLGKVEFLVSPNHFHHLYVKEWKEAYPSAKTYSSKGLQEKKKTFQFDHEIPESFGKEIKCYAIKGAPMVQEWVFYIPNEKALLITDLVLNISPPVGPWTRFYLWFSGITGKPGVSPLIKMLTKDRKSSRSSLQTVLELDFDSLLLAHGAPVIGGGKAALKESYRWLLS